MLKPYIAKALQRTDLSTAEAESALNIIMSGQATPAQTLGVARRECTRTRQADGESHLEVVLEQAAPEQQHSLRAVRQALNEEDWGGAQEALLEFLPPPRRSGPSSSWSTARRVTARPGPTAWARTCTTTP